MFISVAAFGQWKYLFSTLALRCRFGKGRTFHYKIPDALDRYRVPHRRNFALILPGSANDGNLAPFVLLRCVQVILGNFDLLVEYLGYSHLLPTQTVIQS